MKASADTAGLRQKLGNGRRLTGQRKTIAAVIEAAKDHPDAAELHRRAAEIDPHISLSTVYRTLRLFKDLGLIDRHSFADGPARVERAPSVHHDHLIDIGTGKIIEFRSPEIERYQIAIARKLGYDLVGHRLELYGRKRPRGS